MTQAVALAVARPTFDLDLGCEEAAAAACLLEDAGVDIGTDLRVLTTHAEIADQVEEISGSKAEVVILLQATFTDASPVIALAERSSVPILVWSFPERRTGRRLRLNSLCGANLAAFSLRARNHRCAFVHADPHRETSRAAVLAAIEHAVGDVTQPLATAVAVRSCHAASTIPGVRADAHVEFRADATQERLADLRVGVIGDPPVGFEPCIGSPRQIESVIGISIDQIGLGELFDAATGAPPGAVEHAAERFADAVTLDPQLDAASTEPSERLYCGLRALTDDRGLSAIATRCWPECTDSFGGAACTAQAVSTDDGVPAVCEADMLGAVTALVLHAVADDDPFIADLVDLDPSDDTSVLWHCGVAPPRLAHPDHGRRGTVHPNRGVPLVNEFALRPGRVTVARISRSANGLRMVIAGGTMLDRPRPFSGTSGVLRWDLPGRDVVATVFTLGIEHHLGIVYGEHRDVLVELARRWAMPVVRLGNPS